MKRTRKDDRPSRLGWQVMSDLDELDAEKNNTSRKWLKRRIKIYSITIVIMSDGSRLKIAKRLKMGILEVL